jgi:hypothetical protein
VLVNADGIRHKDDIHPAIDAFNHVIVRVDLPGKAYWLDPTRGFQGRDIERVFQPDYGYGLVIAPGEQGLTRMPSNVHLVGYKIEENFDLPEDIHEPVDYHVTSTYSGLDAENLRRRVAEDGVREIQGSYLDYYRKYYPGIKIQTPMQVLDDAARNTLKIVERYRIENFWEKDDEDEEWSADFYANVVGSYLRKPKQRRRSEPFWVSHPEDIEQNIHVKLPEPWDIEEYEFNEKNPFFDFLAKAEYREADNILDLTYRYRSMQDTVSPDATATYIKAVERAKEHLDYYLTQPDARQAAAEGAGQGDWWPDYGIFLLLGLLAAAFVYVFAEWFIDMRRVQLSSPVAYYPVSLLKFAVLSIATLGLYHVYWFYKQWAYIRARDDNAVMPVIRAVFFPFWFYALFRDLRADSIKRFGYTHLPGAFMIVLLLLVYLALSILQVGDEAVSMLGYLDFLCFLPFVNYIQFINRNDAAAMNHNSRFRPRHFILLGGAILVLVYNLAVSLHWMPSEDVIKGSQLPDTSIKFMQRQGLIRDDNDLIYFYSEAFWSNRDDGNGVTRERVFSYWRDEDTGRLLIRTARYPDIDNISVAGDKTDHGTAVITIKPKSGNNFFLYAPIQDNMHMKMIREIESRLSRGQQTDEGNTDINDTGDHQI